MGVGANAWRRPIDCDGAITAKLGHALVMPEGGWQHAVPPFGKCATCRDYRLTPPAAPLGLTVRVDYAGAAGLKVDRLIVTPVR